MRIVFLSVALLVATRARAETATTVPTAVTLLSPQQTSLVLRRDEQSYFLLGPQPSVTRTWIAPVAPIDPVGSIAPAAGGALARLVPIGLGVAGALFASIAMSLGMQIGRLTD